MAITGGNAFVRDRLAWFCYGMLATFNFASASLGPLMTFMQAELKLDYTMTALHFSIWSFGSLLAGLVGDRVIHRLGEPKTVWASCTTACLGLSIIASAHHPAISIPGAFLCGMSGSTMSQALLTLLAKRFSQFRAVAITEANIASSFLASLAPLVVAEVSQTALHWRAALIVPIVCFGGYLLVAGKCLVISTEKEADNHRTATEGKLSGRYWLYWSLIFLSVACEWSMIYWSANFLEHVAKLSKPNAAASVTAFLAAMVTGRIVGSRLVRSVDARVLLKTAALVAFSGFALFWLSSTPLFCISGLFITGLGISNFYPLTFSTAIGCSGPALTAKATSRIYLASGSSVLVAPFLLGLFAEHYGIFAAYGLIAILLVVAGIMVYLPIWHDSDKG